MPANSRFSKDDTAPERGMDGLLDELARCGAEDDIAFLGELEKHLDSVDRDTKEAKRSKRGRWVAICKVAAALAIAGVSLFTFRTLLSKWRTGVSLSVAEKDSSRDEVAGGADRFEVFRESKSPEFADADTANTTAPVQSRPARPVNDLWTVAQPNITLLPAGDFDGPEDSDYVLATGIAASSTQVAGGESPLMMRGALETRGLPSPARNGALDEHAALAAGGSDGTEQNGASFAARLSLDAEHHFADAGQVVAAAGEYDATGRDRFGNLPTGAIEELRDPTPAVGDADAVFAATVPEAKVRGNKYASIAPAPAVPASSPAMPQSRVRYPALVDNTFLSPRKDPLSTFSIDVDTASYSNVRRIIESGQTVPADAVRIEELINYFDYSYPAPGQELPFSVNLEAAAAPWKPEHRLVRVGLKGQEIQRTERQSLNLVFLVDVSGSMNQERKLPLVQRCLHLLIEELREDDTIAIATYAGHEGVALAPTSGAHKQAIHAAVDRLRSAGGTNGEAGIKLAYRLASERFSQGGVNRILLATDGDFNIGVSSTQGLRDLVRAEAKRGVFMSVLGFGSDNLNDAMLETITNDGNGTYHYIDGVSEGRRVLVEDLTSTLITIAKDVKIQIEFNPATVGAYRLIGYANRMLPPEAFNDDRIDAGDIGAGHTVTAFYEVIPPGLPNRVKTDLKYQTPVVPEPRNLTPTGSGELLTVKLRYKSPHGTASQLIEVPFTDGGKPFSEASNDFRFAASVAAFGMHLRQSPHSGTLTRDQILAIVENASGAVNDRRKFAELIRNARFPEPR